MPFHESGEMTRVYTVCHHCAAGFVKLAPGQCTVTVYLTPVFVFNFWISFSVSIPFLFVIMQGSQRPSPDVFISYDHGKELIDPEIEAEAQIIAHGMPPMRPTSQAPNGFLTFKQYYCRGTPEEAAAIWNRLPARENQKWRRISEIRRTFSVGTTAQENDIPSLQRPTSRGGQSSPNDSLTPSQLFEAQTKAPWPAPRPVNPDAIVQHSRVIAGAVWPPSHHLPSLDLTPEPRLDYPPYESIAGPSRVVTMDTNEMVSDTSSVSSSADSPVSPISSTDSLDTADNFEEGSQTNPIHVDDGSGEDKNLIEDEESLGTGVSE
ncbi:hypothetical protein HHX47_DHR3000747 [Lentinula edodes]|nr:hypothetical protein HHX47_DHR3000747 [Lentinula edodes]